jgi:hypothetical protein
MIVLGMFLCSASSLKFSVVSLVFATISNICFAIRNILASAVFEDGFQPVEGRTDIPHRYIGSFELYVLISFGGSTVLTLIYFSTELHGSWRERIYHPEMVTWEKPNADQLHWVAHVDDQDPMKIIVQLSVAGMVLLMYNAASFQV